MSNLSQYGAINKFSGEYVLPKDAIRSKKYKCPDCEQDVFVKQGDIKIHHFAHCVEINDKSKTKCKFYSHPRESESHLNAKVQLQAIINKKVPLKIYFKCVECEKKKYVNFNLNNFSNPWVELEYNFGQDYKADVALLDDYGLQIIFEIYHTSYTKQETRPEPWYEIKASELSDEYSKYNFNNLELEPEPLGCNSSGIDIPFVIHCIRKRKCNSCAKIFDNKRNLFNSHPLVKKLHENNIKFVTNMQNNCIELKHNQNIEGISILKYCMQNNEIYVNNNKIFISYENIIEMYNSPNNVINGMINKLENEQEKNCIGCFEKKYVPIVDNDKRYYCICNKCGINIPHLKKLVGFNMPPWLNLVGETKCIFINDCIVNLNMVKEDNIIVFNGLNKLSKIFKVKYDDKSEKIFLISSTHDFALIPSNIAIYIDFGKKHILKLVSIKNSYSICELYEINYWLKNVLDIPNTNYELNNLKIYERNGIIEEYEQYQLNQNTILSQIEKINNLKYDELGETKYFSIYGTIYNVKYLDKYEDIFNGHKLEKINEYKCDKCNKQIKNFRYSCKNKDDYDLCDKCFDCLSYNKISMFKKIKLKEYIQFDNNMFKNLKKQLIEQYLLNLNRINITNLFYNIFCDYCGLEFKCKCNESSHELCKKFISLENSFCPICNKKFDLQIDKTKITQDYLNELNYKWQTHKNSCACLYKLNNLEKNVCEYCETKFDLQIDKNNLSQEYLNELTNKWNLAHANCWIIKYPQDLFIKHNQITKDAFIKYINIDKDIFSDLCKQICLKCLFCSNMLQYIYEEDEYDKFNTYMKEIYFFENFQTSGFDSVIEICGRRKKRYYNICKTCVKKIRENKFYNDFIFKNSIFRNDYPLSEKQINIIKKLIVKLLL